ncbi:MAG: hypothetical protein IM504_23270 [Microcystis sp. M038S2]|jgi:hypothetical protein|uniref:hypothetical protein n=1 Tax=unclassified Microcystis TaxID=2643300 RepID=UPI0011908C21|nr:MULTISPECIES: hypothetical protein [unclassified Microcystis]TRU59544.1 MAG: hypothetical protein EWV48_14600 [Microcystis aeruginosa Ma_QC_C_20070823_S13]TRU62241.1 MAG: hypothetical protein EWV56_07540 [Microcystis aeruginosa Ma_QC_C_20070823_S13D]MCA2685946.1 hypothetical protein [Microcystis sp. M046S2]MCA2707606.1 hypothetical protein [Microcystis sp. M038S2]MCA2948953.1 hypothetical protein [Microcystis sp. M109S1]
MPSQIITNGKTPNTFVSQWQNDLGHLILGSKITLDFNPVIKASGLIDNFVIVHYQAKPIFLRRFGVVATGEYFSVSSIEAKTPYRSVLVHETNLLFPPNGVLIHANSRVVVDQGGVATIIPA